MKDSTALFLIALPLFVLVLIGAGTTIENPLCNQCPMVGIRITHDGHPISHLYIQVHNFRVEPTFTTGSTDESGTFQFRSGWLWVPQDFLYTFTWDGQAYAFQGPNNQIVDDPI